MGVTIIGTARTRITGVVYSGFELRTVTGTLLCDRVQCFGRFEDVREKRVGEPELVVVPAVHRTQITVNDLCQGQVDNRRVRIADDVATDERMS